MPQTKRKTTLQEVPSKVWQNPIYFLAFGFGSGLLKKAPGTWGTCAAIPLYCFIASTSLLAYALIIGIAFAAGVYICQSVTNDLGLEDYSGIVWDEIVGYLITMYGLPFHWIWMVLGFGLFRVLDIYKPQPIRWVERQVPGGLGIMLDDVLAGLAACLMLHIINWGVSGI
jgi:phosphatidylglycerophosphatase A